MKKFFYLMLVANAVTAAPLFLTPSSGWQEKMQLILGNCVNSCPYCRVVEPKDSLKSSLWLDLVVIKAPQTKSFERLPGYQEFSWRHQQRSQQIVGLWDPGENKNGVLTLIPHEHSSHQFDFELPFSVVEGTLTVADAYYKDNWYTLLGVLAKDRLTQKSVLWIFDMTDPTKPLEPLRVHDLGEFITEKDQLQIVRLNNGSFAIVIVGSLQEQGSIMLFFLDELKPPRHLKIGGNRLSFLIAVDLYQQGVVDKLYVGGSQQLWVIDCANIDQVSIKKLAKVEVVGLPIIIPDRKGEGTQIYFLGSFTQQKGLWVIHDNGSQGILTPPIKLVKEGDFIGFFIRFGYFLLVPKNLAFPPLAFNLSSHQPIPIHWQTLYKDKSEFNLEARLVRLMWEPKEQKEILLILNSSCQLNILSGSLTEHQYGRVSWRQF